MIQVRQLVLARHGRPSEAVAIAESQFADEPALETVRVRMLASPVHPSDSLMIMNRYGHRVTQGAVLGSEGIGVIDAVGSGRGLQIGQRVVVVPTYRYGTWTTVLDIKETDLVAVPVNVTDDQAAFAGVNPLTALGLLQGVSCGDWVIQNAANSASARNVASVARHRNINVINVVRRPGAAALLRNDEHVIATRANHSSNRSTPSPAVRRSKLASTYTAVSSEPLQAWAPNLIFRGITIEGFWLLTWLQQQSDETVRKSYETVFALLADGSVHTDIGYRYTLAEHVDALRLATTPERAGKVLFDFTNE
jgi:NADPH:quinone reductase-like Zn-dependent oxidoreductase